MFHIILVIHILAGLLCLVAGMVAMSAKKRKGIHTAFGEIYHGSYVVVFASTIVMSIWHWDTSAYLFYIGLFSYALALLGYLAAKIRWKNWLSAHIGGMLGSYIGIITASIVVNISKVPVLNDLPPLLFWLLPTIIGTPLIFRVGKKYAPARK